MSESKFTLLIVEDDPDMAEMLTAFFQKEGYTILIAERGEQAVRLCSKNHPDLILLDIRLPDIDGFEVASRLRNNQRTRHIPIIFLTEKRQRDDRMRGLEIGADDYLTKPFDIQELRLRVRNSLLSRRQSGLTNPITGLPQNQLLEERLEECFWREDWALLLVALENWEGFRETYGFVAADDLQRALSLMLRSALRELGGPNDFLGQLTASRFLILTRLLTLPTLREGIRSVMEPSLKRFYPLQDHDHIPPGAALRLHLVEINAASAPFATPQEVIRHLAQKSLPTLSP